MTPTLTFRLTGVVADLDETTPGEREHSNFRTQHRVRGGLCADRRADERLAVENRELPGVDLAVTVARESDVDRSRQGTRAVATCLGYWIVTTRCHPAPRAGHTSFFVQRLSAWCFEFWNRYQQQVTSAQDFEWLRPRMKATKPSTNFRILSRVAASVISPFASMTPPAREIRRRPPDQKSAPRVRKMGSHAF